MRREIIYKGLLLQSDKSQYFFVQEGSSPGLIETNNTLTLTYISGSTAKSVSESLGIKLVGPGNDVLEPMTKATKFKNTYLTLNEIKFQKLTYDPHTVNIILVRDSESRVVQTYSHTVIIVSKEDYENPEFINFLFYSGNFLYIKPYGPKKTICQIYNFPKIIVKDSDITLTSTNDNLFTLRRRYNDYLIRAIDYQDQFILEIRRLLDNYGIELVRVNKEMTLSSTSYITYQFSQTPIKYAPMKRGDPDRNIMSHKQPVDFTLHTTDMVLLHDFKNKYSNSYLLTNFATFKTSDKVGDRWSAAIKWSAITEDFNHVYQPDDNSNFSWTCSFRAELYFYEVLDTRWEFLSEIIQILEVEDTSQTEETIVK